MALQYILNKYGGVEWIELAQDRAMQQAFVNTVMNARVP
jgi:hypothetical protein